MRARNDFCPHQITWTREKAIRFWDHLASQGTSYFSKEAGGAIISFVRRHIPLRGLVLDYGCGLGFLLEELLAKRISCQGVDFSEKSVEIARARLSTHPLLKGVEVIQAIATPFADATFSAVFCIEVIEHLVAQELSRTITEFGRILTRGGYVVIITPNQEDLAAHRVICPECGCIFHAMQHTRTWGVVALTTLMEEYGFETVACRATVLVSPLWLRFPYRLIKKIRGSQMPQLIYIGRKLKEPGVL